MAEPIIMPKQGQSVESCIISQWHKKKGDKVSKGDILFSYETDKASFDEEAPVDGILLDVFFEEGDDVPCLLNVCVIGQEGESTEEFRPKSEEEETAVQEEDTGKVTSEDVAADVSQATEVQTAETAAVTQPMDAADVKISPRARNLAEKLGVDIRYASPTGPYGRIIEQDVVALRDSGHMLTPAAQAAAASGMASGITGTGLGGRITTSDLKVPAVAGETTTAQPGLSSEDWLVLNPAFEEVKVPNIRKVIAKAMHQSLATTAQLTLNTTFDATELLAYRKKLKEAKDRMGLENITINDMIMFAVSRTLLNHRDLNAHFLGDTVRYFSNVNLGCAVDTDRGLMVPTIFGADRLSLNELSLRAKQLAAECKAGSINPDLLQNGSFTVTNLGTLDIESFTPVLNPPQTGILGVNNIVQRVREVDGDYEFYPAMGLSLTFDHRAVDGAPAARFLKELKINLENFSVLLTR
ncbi:MAG: dihydrolipoamide acetyltransferase family protein [Caldicoprobacterales bacterium]|jgi:pyruvate dehydrogenase E2 component (dihydrolipoamide acetyltransferase)|nr:2-oxo acid dehydrogenase subunit E2 [Clostridiales bacterium]